MSGKNVKVFELTIFLSSTMNMVTQIIYLGRMEVGDWNYAVCFKNNIFLMGFTAVLDYRHFNMNFNDNLHQRPNHIKFLN